MKKNLILSALIALTLFNSCQKNTQAPVAEKTMVQGIVQPGKTSLSGSYGSNFARILADMKRPANNKTIVVAHRGLWNSSIPENSLVAISEAVGTQIEAVELDIKLSKDGTPIAMHDYDLRRTTNVQAKFPNEHDYQVGSFNNSQIQSLNLRQSSYSNSITNAHPPTLFQVLDYIKQNRMNLLLSLDIKDAASLRECWKIVNSKTNADGVPARDWVIFKVKANTYSSLSQLEGDLGISNEIKNYDNTSTFKMMMVVGTNMVDNVPYMSLVNEFRKKNYCYGVEVLYKQDNGLLSDLENSVNTYYAGDIPTCLANFHAVPDAGGNRFWKDGGGTYVLSDLYYHSSCCGSDTDDKRGDDVWELNKGNVFITTDNPQKVIQDAKNLGKRADSWQ